MALSGERKHSVALGREIDRVPTRRRNAVRLAGDGAGFCHNPMVASRLPRCEPVLHREGLSYSSRVAVVPDETIQDRPFPTCHVQICHARPAYARLRHRPPQHGRWPGPHQRVTDQRIIEAMLTVPREAFVPPRAQALAYLDLDLDVSEPAGGNRFLLKPVVVARLLQAAGIGAADSVLVAGCATGYTAALAARRAQRVHATDPDPALVARARAALDSQSLDAVTVAAAAVATGDPAQAVRCHVLEARPSRAAVALPAVEGGGGWSGVSARGGCARPGERSRDDFGSRILFDAGSGASGLHAYRKLFLMVRFDIRVPFSGRPRNVKSKGYPTGWNRGAPARRCCRHVPFQEFPRRWA